MLDLLAELSPSKEDPGLSELVKISPLEEGVSLGVVTGQVEPQTLGIVGRIRQKYGMVTLVTVGERFGRPAPPVRGVLTLNVATSDDFARAWPLLVRREHLYGRAGRTRRASGPSPVPRSRGAPPRWGVW